MYYTHYGYQTSIFGKNCTYYIRIFTVIIDCEILVALLSYSLCVNCVLLEHYFADADVQQTP